MTDSNDLRRNDPVPRPREDLVFRRLGEEWVLFDPDGRKLHVMNLTAALVWTHLDGERAVEDLVRAVRDAFADPPETPALRDDVQAILDELAAKDLLRDVDPERGGSDGGGAGAGSRGASSR